jgi:two-component system, OmpR family, sensor histidine kinase CiaH
MKKLKNKMFWVIFSILTIFLASILCIFNYQDYVHEKKEIENNLMRAQETRDEQFRPDNKPEKMENQNNEEDKIPIFMDIIAYTVIYNENNEIVDIINHTQKNISEDQIKKTAENILKQNNKINTKVGNLYFDDYSYSFKGQNVLTIIDNQMAQKKLINLLRTSIIIFVFLEIAILILSLKITGWIIKPVIKTFNMQKQFIADASHELKTPVAVIMANADALEKEPNEVKWLNNIKSESERMNELISDLLDLAKLENGNNKEIYNEEDLSKIVEKTLLTFESLIYEDNIKLKYDIQKDIKIKCNSGQIKQLVAILIDNAIQHTEKNGEIKVSLEKKKGYIQLKVSNKGKEIPKEMQEKIFERFYRVDEARTRDTNRYGLGLAIAKNIVNNHNGKISVQCENGYTTFNVHLSFKV